ncbi:MAG: hypothetical protein HY904_06560 [Deltaproteobacteria bacterium]|nr:hypothetical protein [Deltaproteobacteria bacterium]
MNCVATVLVLWGTVAPSAVESAPQFVGVSDAQLIPMLANDDPYSQAVSVELDLRLGLPPGPSAYPAAQRRGLVNLLIANAETNPDQRIRIGSSATLCLAATFMDADRDVIAQHMRRILSDSTQGYRRQAEMYLRDLVSFDKSAEALSAIQAFLENQDPQRPNARAEELALLAIGTSGEAGLPFLIGYMPKNGIDAARAIAETGSWKGFRFLRKEALRRDNRHRWACTSALRFWAEKQPTDSQGRAKAVRTLQRLGCDDDLRIKQTALSLLAKLGASAPAHCPAEDDDEDEGHDEGDHDGDRVRKERDDRPRSRSAKDEQGGHPRH